MRLHGPDEPVYTIGVVARLLNISPQTLRQFEREGLIEPSRTENNMRLYSQNELVMLQRICYLVKSEGVNIAGVRAVMRIERRYGVTTATVHTVKQRRLAGPPAPEDTEEYQGRAPDDSAAAPDDESDRPGKASEPSGEAGLADNDDQDQPRKDRKGTYNGASLGLMLAAALLDLGGRWC